LENVNHCLEEEGLEHKSGQQLSQQDVFVLSIHELNDHVNRGDFVVFQILVHVDALKELFTFALVDNPSNSKSYNFDWETLVVARADILLVHHVNIELVVNIDAS
jgi:hypothetical protein